MHKCTFHIPQSVQEACQIWQSHEESSFLAGGQTIVQAIKLGLSAPQQLISLQKVEVLDRIERQSQIIRIGAMATHNSVGQSRLVRDTIPALAELASGIGDPSVRSRGTIGGSIANADPAACYPAALVALGAVVITNQRRINVADFFLDLYTTALEPGELVVAVDFPIPSSSSYIKFRHPASRFAIVGVFVARFDSKVQVATTGAQVSASRVPVLEHALSEKFHPQSTKGIELDSSRYLSDAFGSQSYRAALVRYGAEKAVSHMMVNAGVTL
jgi:aerobic carbon-monoxide dehydrogenase medium subunit